MFIIGGTQEGDHTLSQELATPCFGFRKSPTKLLLLR